MKLSKPTFLPLLFSLIFLLSCKPSNSENQASETPAAEEKQSLPSLGNEEISNLYAITEKSDIIFYDLPISINQDDAPSAKNSVLYIQPAPVTLNNACKAWGRISWMSEGVIVKEADIYADSLCKYFVFINDNKQVAAN